ncbi:hypothetical protein [Solimonas soli]|uniref:hypothetical protein n=1 Tax=Solimonas soli TaxID=413479 RepID=UPI0004AE493F|nr:hypothetical protein [Solimonas soli]
MLRNALLAVACATTLLPLAQAAPPVADPAPAEQTFKPATISSEAYVPKTTIGPEDPLPNCQIKIGSDWSETPTRTLDDCAALLDQKTPAQPKPMTTAYWNNLYLSADDKNIYQADPKSSAWSVLRPRQKR